MLLLREKDCKTFWIANLALCPNPYRENSGGLIEEEPFPTIEDSAILQLPDDLEFMDLVAKHEGYGSAAPRAIKSKHTA